jgi:hypothetical protein
MAAHLADKPARSLHHRSELVAENAVGAANNMLRLAEGSGFNVVFFEGHSCYHNNNTENQGGDNRRAQSDYHCSQKSDLFMFPMISMIVVKSGCATVASDW